MSLLPSATLPKDYPEDFEHENGNYWNECIRCHTSFVGHKRRPLCKVCNEMSRQVEKLIKENKGAFEALAKL